MTMQRDVTICEMSPRDGLQVVNRTATIPLDRRVALVAALQRANLPYIEAGAFVSERRVPAMRDTDELLARCTTYDGRMAALVPNLRYFDRFKASPVVDTVALFVSVSEHYSQKNTRMSVAGAVAAAADVAEAAVAAGYRLRAHLSAAFRDLTEQNRPTPVREVDRVCADLREMSSDMVIALADTDGRATADDIDHVIGRIGKSIGFKHIGVHLHDRDGGGLANAQHAYDLGVRIFDAAVGGIGGNPTALEHVAGNVATEELVRMFADMGVETGIDLDALFEAGAIVTEMTTLVGDPPPPSRLLATALKSRDRSDEDTRR